VLLLLLQVRDLVGRSAARDHLRQMQRMHYVADVLPHQLLIIENVTQLAGHYMPYGSRPGVLVQISSSNYSYHSFGFILQLC
jgi:hypothetical protein